MRNKSINSTVLCRCGNARGALNCCERFISEREKVVSPEQLMRARYVAYAMGNMNYVARTWHSRTRPDELVQNDAIEWLELEVISASPVSAKQTQGYVEFKASFRNKTIDPQKISVLHERSRFVMEDDQWFYLDGEQFEVRTVTKKTGRNEPCFCASGKKFKKCCGKD